LRASPTNWFLLAFAASAALLWAALIPLWDGFDEAQHYSYIQSLRSDRAWPVLGQTRITPEVWASLVSSPVSPAVKMNYPMLRTFSEDRAKTLPTTDSPAAPTNYEAHQAPMVYLVFAPLEGALWRAGMPIAWRLRFLRFCLLACSMVMFWRIAAVSPHRGAAWFMILTTEMFLASCGHVANDGVAIPIFAWLFFEAERRSRLAVLLLGTGLLAKAYFLAFVPFVVWRLRKRWRWLLTASVLPAVWYGRNLRLYGNLSGMQEQRNPLRPGDLFHAALHLPWAASLGETFRGALWLANNSFLQWSVWQVGLVIAGLLVAVCVSLRRNSRRRNWLLAYAGCYLAALAYAAVQTFVYTNGAGVAASPWYATPLWLLLILMIFAGETAGWVLSSLIAIWTYWFVATFWFRLIPWYAGVMNGSANAANLFRWYGSSFGQMRNEIGDPVLILTLTTSLLAIATAALLCCELRGRLQGRHEESSYHLGRPA
jgi:hypothetical protein